MSEISYQFRAGSNRKERTYQLTDNALTWREASGGGSLPYSEVRKIRLFGSPSVINPMLGATTVLGSQICVISGGRGHKHVLSSNQLVRFGKFEDRSKELRAFVTALIQRVAAVNSKTLFISGMPIVAWTVWLAVLILYISVICFFAFLLIELIPKGTEELLNLVLSVIFLVGLIAGLPSTFLVVSREWPRRFNPRQAIDAR